MITWNRKVAGDGERWVHVRCVLEFKIDIPGENMRTSRYQLSLLPLLFVYFLREIQRKLKKRLCNHGEKRKRTK